MGAPCSGFRSLITMLALALVYVYVKGGPVFKKGLLIAAVLPFALAGNVIRIVLLALITYHFGKEAGEGFFHYFSGGVIFVVMIALLMWLEGYLND